MASCKNLRTFQVGPNVLMAFKTSEHWGSVMKLHVPVNPLGSMQDAPDLVAGLEKWYLFITVFFVKWFHP